MEVEMQESAEQKECINLWPVDVVSEFILFETMQMKPQMSIRKYA